MCLRSIFVRHHFYFDYNNKTHYIIIFHRFQHKKRREKFARKKSASSTWINNIYRYNFAIANTCSAKWVFCTFLPSWKMSKMKNEFAQLRRRRQRTLYHAQKKSDSTNIDINREQKKANNLIESKLASVMQWGRETRKKKLHHILFEAES